MLQALRGSRAGDGGLFDYYAWKHLVYGQLSLGIWIGFGMIALLSIPVTFFGLILAAILLVR